MRRKFGKMEQKTWNGAEDLWNSLEKYTKNCCTCMYKKKNRLAFKNNVHGTENRKTLLNYL